jgi:hypothetical protein
MGWLCDSVSAIGAFVIADFICPTEEARAVFGDAFMIWVDRIKESRFPDTDAIFDPPSRYDVRVSPEGPPSYWVEKICERLLPGFNPMAPTALFVGRYQPFHDGHKALIEEGLKRVGQACIAVRNTHGMDDKNPWDFPSVKARIEAALWEHRDRISVISLPNVTHVFYGRDVGYAIEQLKLDESIERISGTRIRKRLGAH